MKKLAGFLGGLAVLVVSSPLAHANFVLSYQIGAGAIVNCANAASDTLATCFAVPTAIGSGLTVTTFQGTSNSPGAPTNSMQTGSVTDITATTAGVTLTLWLAAQDFTTPITPPPIIDATSLTVIPTNGTGSVTLVNCVDQSNGTAPPLPGVFCSAPAFTNTNPVINYSGTTSQSNNAGGTFSPLASPFSLSEKVTIGFTTAGEIEVQTRQVLTSVPEPTSIMLLGSVTLGLVSLFRKKLAGRS